MENIVNLYFIKIILMDINLQSITEQVIEIAREVAVYIKNESENFSLEKVQVKSKNDFVSYVDKETEKQLVEKLKKLVPDAGFITEENTIASEEKEYQWIIDPLDGTTNFIHNSTPYAISIALTHKMQPIIGVVYEITRDEMFYSWLGSKSFLNGVEIHVSEINQLSNAMIAFGRPHHYMERYPELLASVDYFMKNTHAIRINGSAATELAYVACGRYDGRYEFNLKPWDIAAGILIIENAGGNVCDFNGEKNYFKNGAVVASNKGIFDEFRKKISELFK